MPNLHKFEVLKALRERFGELHKIKGSESLFTIGEDAARVYVRYSKVHPGGRNFFGLREVDLRQLEGHNGFLCFLLDDGSPPLFVPYGDFEEVFRNAQTASDGQYKVQLLSRENGLELYVARQGRFNVEGYVGLEPVARSLNTALLRQAQNLTHAQVQTLLAGIGHFRKYRVYVPERDAGGLDWTLTERFALRRGIPSGFEQVRGILSEIDVIWTANGGETIEGLFEVEHSTTVYSGLLRFNDILLTDPKVSRFSIVSNETRRALFSRQLFRPTFKKERACRANEFSRVLERTRLAHARSRRRHAPRIEGKGGKRQMKIEKVHSHLGGLEFMTIHLPEVLAEIESAIVGADGRNWKTPRSTARAARDVDRHSSTRIKKGIGSMLRSRGWKTRRPGDSGFAKNRVGVEIQFGRRPLDTYDLCARHIARYIGKVIDVGVEILPMKSLQQQMSSGIGYYEGELYNLIREGRGVPAVPLVLIGICPD